jgi:antitoxin (DNA-binding transcriptional repressor) of toxin-antitoxin stability system
VTVQTITVEEAQSHLAEILAKLVSGEEVVLTRDDKPAAIIRSISPFAPQAPDAARGIPGNLAVQTVSVAEGEAHLFEMVGQLSPEEEIVLTGNGKLIATIRSPQFPLREPPRFGTLKRTIRYIAPDFDDIPEGFEEYLP